jgi:transcriptional regulator with XRE-family HTH domain
MNPESIYEHIGEVIRTRRKALKPRLTQEGLAQRVGISRASLANIETGRQNVLVHQLYAFAKALNLSPGDFLLPANDTGARAEWSELLPDDLKPQQKDQLARMLADSPAEPSRDKEEYGKQTKR